jgi:DegV family protein with EDD domain
MGNFKIYTDSASDISYEDEKRCDIRMLPFKIMLGDKSYVSRVDFDNEGFYELMAQNDEIPKTSQITPYEFQELYLKEASEGTTDLILVLINSHGSATYGNSVMAKDSFFEEHPEYADKLHIYCVDGMGYNGMYGWPVLQAAKMREEGTSAADIAAYLTELMPKREIYFGIYELKYAAKSGRIPTAAAFIGDRLGLKPVMKIFDQEITTAAKCRGEKNLITKIADLTMADMAPGTPYQMVYGCDETCLAELTRVMTERIGYAPTDVFQIGAAVAANAGPKVVGTIFTRK